MKRMLPVLLGAWILAACAAVGQEAGSDLRTKIPGGKGTTEIIVQADGTLLVEDQAIALEKLLEKLRKNVEKDADHSVLLRGDKETPFQRIAQVLEACRAAGISNLALPAK
jgi:biopolymer transport protein ExbD